MKVYRRECNPLFLCRYNNQLTVLRNDLRSCKKKATEQSKLIADQQKLIADQQKQAIDYATRLDENDKKNEEISRKFSTILQVCLDCAILRRLVTDIEFFVGAEQMQNGTSILESFGQLPNRLQQLWTDHSKHSGQ